jgi:tripartite-type tricarboxylate transporter receptor subunit TctC
MRRSAINVPTYAESGFGRFTAASWVGVFAPAKTDAQIVATAINDTIKTTEGGMVKALNLSVK